jgi:DNA topoisomerase VI subunit A
MLVTSKGYPDYNTQAFLKNILVHANGIYYLGDLDPYGFDIMLEYAVGDSFEQFGVPEL